MYTSFFWNSFNDFLDKRPFVLWTISDFCPQKGGQMKKNTFKMCQLHFTLTSVKNIGPQFRYNNQDFVQSGFERSIVFQLYCSHIHQQSLDVNHIKILDELRKIYFHSNTHEQQRHIEGIPHRVEMSIHSRFD